MNNGFLYLGAFIYDKLAGVIAFKNWTHLYNLFVSDEFQDKGIARKLWDTSMGQLKEFEVTVFSSSYALPVYKKLGFLMNGNKIDDEELVCFPMIWKNKK